jgi:hypothetical protein
MPSWIGCGGVISNLHSRWVPSVAWAAGRMILMPCVGYSEDPRQDDGDLGDKVYGE